MFSVVLISGKQGSGKSTLARNLYDRLNDETNNVPVKCKFAEPLYKMHDAIRKILKRDGMDQLVGIDGPLMQLLGTEWGRKTRGENFWMDYAKQTVFNDYRTRSREQHTVYIFDDCRFPNELRAFGKDAFKIRLQADEDIRKGRAEKWRDSTEHPSEIALDAYLNEFHFIFDTNVCNKHDLAEQVFRKTLQFVRGNV